MNDESNNGSEAQRHGLLPTTDRTKQKVGTNLSKFVHGAQTSAQDITDDAAKVVKNLLGFRDVKNWESLRDEDLSKVSTSQSCAPKSLPSTSEASLSSENKLSYALSNCIAPVITHFEPKFIEVFTAYCQQTHGKIYDVSAPLMSLCLDHLLALCCWIRESNERCAWIRKLMDDNVDLRPEVRNGLSMVHVYAFAAAKAVGGKEEGSDMFAILQDPETGFGIVNKTSLKIYNDPYNYFGFIKSCISGLIDCGKLPENERQNQPKKPKKITLNREELVAFLQLKSHLVNILNSGDSLTAKNKVEQIMLAWQYRPKVTHKMSIHELDTAIITLRLINRIVPQEVRSRRFAIAMGVINGQLSPIGPANLPVPANLVATVGAASATCVDSSIQMGPSKTSSIVDMIPMEPGQSSSTSVMSTLEPYFSSSSATSALSSSLPRPSISPTASGLFPSKVSPSSTAPLGYRLTTPSHVNNVPPPLSSNGCKVGDDLPGALTGVSALSDAAGLLLSAKPFNSKSNMKAPPTATSTKKASLAIVPLIDKQLTGALAMPISKLASVGGSSSVPLKSSFKQSTAVDATMGVSPSVLGTVNTITDNSAPGTSEWKEIANFNFKKMASSVPESGCPPTDIIAKKIKKATTVGNASHEKINVMTTTNAADARHPRDIGSISKQIDSNDNSASTLEQRLASLQTFPIAGKRLNSLVDESSPLPLPLPLPFTQSLTSDNATELQYSSKKIKPNPPYGDEEDVNDDIEIKDDSCEYKRSPEVSSDDRLNTAVKGQKRFIKAIRFERVGLKEWSLKESRVFNIDKLLLASSSSSVICLIDETRLSDEELRSGLMSASSSNGLVTLQSELAHRQALVTSWPKTDYPHLSDFVNAWQQAFPRSSSTLGQSSSPPTQPLVMSLSQFWYDTPHHSERDEEVAAQNCSLLGASTLAYETIMQVGIILRACTGAGVHEDCWRLIYPNELQDEPLNSSFAAFLCSFFPQLRTPLGQLLDLKSVVVKYYPHHVGLPVLTPPAKLDSTVYQTIGTLDEPAGSMLRRFGVLTAVHDIIIQVYQ